LLDDEPAPKPNPSFLGVFLAGFVAAGALALAAFVGWQQFGPSSAPAAAAGGHSVGSAPAMDASEVAAAVAQEIAKLGIKPHMDVATTDKSMSAADALRRGDLQAAETISKAVLAQSTLQSFSFAPFNRYMGSLSQGGDAKYLDGLNAWALHSPKSALPYLLRASYYYTTAWSIRGEDFSAAVPDAHRQGFQDFLKLADEDVRRSIAIDAGIPWSYFLRLEITAVRGDSQELDADFRDGIAHFPAYYELYHVRFRYLQPKWGGSTAAMYEFVEQYAGNAAPSSPLKLLYMQLAANLQNAAWVECRSFKHEALTACVDSQMNRLVTGGLTDGVTQALGLYKQLDPVQYSDALWPILNDMVRTPGTSTTSVMQLAADAMGSDNQLVHNSKNNNFVLDDVTAWIWTKLDNPVNVDQKFREALSDAVRMPFPNEDERDVALASIYDDMATAARGTSQYSNVIIYHDTANAIAGPNHGGAPYLKCFAYFKLHAFQEAVDECTRVMNAHRDVLTAQYTRARAYESLKQYDAALADFAPVAENGSDNYTRDGAVIEMEHINALLGNFSTELEIFEKYPFVFDESIQAPDDVAIAYNNRCFAYMKLGKLKEALDDCNNSLKYGRLPDALQKQQQLVKLLSAQTT